jgi:hypothetical protein
MSRRPLRTNAGASGCPRHPRYDLGRRPKRPCHYLLRQALPPEPSARFHGGRKASAQDLGEETPRLIRTNRPARKRCSATSPRRCPAHRRQHRTAHLPPRLRQAERPHRDRAEGHDHPPGLLRRLAQGDVRDGRRQAGLQHHFEGELTVRQAVMYAPGDVRVEQRAKPTLMASDNTCESAWPAAGAAASTSSRSVPAAPRPSTCASPSRTAPWPPPPHCGLSRPARSGRPGHRPPDERASPPG